MVAEGAVLAPRIAQVTGGYTEQRRPWRAELRRGYKTMLPLWLGVAPFGVTYGVLAQQAGFGAIETQLSSMLIYAGAAQMAMISLFDDGSAFIAIILTTFVLNLRHILYGLSLSRELGSGTVGRAGRSWPRSSPTSPTASPSLTDRKATQAAGPTPSSSAPASASTPHSRSRPYWDRPGRRLARREKLGLELVFPLSFAVLLLPLLRTWRTIAVASVAAALVLAAGQVFDGGVALLIATIGGAGLGAMLDGRVART